MAEYINKDLFVKCKRKQYCEDCHRRMGTKRGKECFVYEIGDAPCRACGINDMLDEVEDFPSIDANITVHAKWIDVPDDHLGINYQCSFCDKKTYTAKQYDLHGNEYCFEYCPHCGARMDGET